MCIRDRRTAYGKGKSYNNNDKPKIRLILLFFLKIFKIDTNFRLARGLAESGVGWKDRLYFHIKFFQILVFV